MQGSVWLGVDGGGTGCRALAVDAAGQVIGRGAAGPANIVTDPEGACANILAAAAQALAGVAPPQVRAVLGLAGANVAPAVARLVAGLPFGHAQVVSDALASVRGALGVQDGIVAALGTGSVFAVQRGGSVRQIGGWGLVLGDEASGAWLGRAALAQALRARDGLAPASRFLDTLVAGMGGPDAVVAFALRATPADFAALAPAIVEAAAAGSKAAAGLMDAAAFEASRAIAALQPDDGPPLPVVFLGGLGPALALRLGGRWTVLEPAGSALDGALMIARATMP